MKTNNFLKLQVVELYIRMYVRFTAKTKSTKGQYNIAREIIRCREFDKQKKVHINNISHFIRLATK